jgi:hypothetical protein
VRRVGGPRARERRAEWWVGGPRARESYVQRRKRRGPRALGAFGLGVLHAVGWSAGVQQYCGGGPFSAMVSAPMLPYQWWSWWITSAVSIQSKSVVVGWKMRPMLVLTVLTTHSDRPVSIAER